MNQRPEFTSRPTGDHPARARVPGFVALIFVMLLLAVGLAQLFRLRFQSGDIYPPYSTLRSDPLGARAFCESLNRLAGQSDGALRATRNFRPLDHLTQETEGATVFFLGLPVADSWATEIEAEQLEQVARGGRLVLTFFPTAQQPNLLTLFDREARRTPRPEEKGEAKEQGDEVGRTRQDRLRRQGARDEDQRPPWDSPSTKTISLGKRWGFAFDRAALPKEPDGALTPVWAERRAPLDLPEAISWHSSSFFKELSPEWRVIYERDGKAVIVERRLGNGQLVLASDSYLFSNEALRQETRPRLLAWMIGDANAVVFDETHLGVAEQRSMGYLARKYRLHGVLAGLLLLAGLFIWKNSTSLVPPVDEARAGERQALAAGRDYFSGLIGLLRRNIKPPDILFTCFQEWMKSLKYQPRNFSAKARRIEELVEAEKARPARERNPAAAYREACRILRPGVHGRQQAKKPATEPHEVQLSQHEVRPSSKGDRL
jgi:hypothetical protein